VVEKQAGRARRIGVPNPCAARGVLEHHWPQRERRARRRVWARPTSG